MASGNADLKEYQDYVDYQKYQAAPQPHSFGDKANAAIQGAGNFYSFGQLPKLQAGVQSLMPDPSQDVDDYLRDHGVKVPQSDYNNYDAALKSYENQRQQVATEMPDEYYGGEGAAALTAAVPGGLMAGQGLLKGGKALYQFSNSAPGQMLEKAAIPVGAYLLGKRKGGE